jgi:hypothetical protein
MVTYNRGTGYGKFHAHRSSRGKFPHLTRCPTTAYGQMGTWELGMGGRALPAGDTHRARGGTGVPLSILFFIIKSIGEVPKFPFGVSIR